VGSVRRRIARPSVDLPQPDSPTSPNVSPLRISRLTPSTAFTRPKWTLRSRIEIRISDVAGCDSWLFIYGSTFTARGFVDLIRKVTKRRVITGQLDEWRKLTVANLFR